MGDVAAGVVDVRLQQHRVARRLVDLDVVAVGQQPLELRAVEAGGAADQRHARRIEVELVLAHRLRRRRPRSMLGLEIVDEAGLAELRRDHLVGAEHPEIFRDQRVMVDGRAGSSSAIEIAFMHEPVALQLHLPPRHVEAGDQLLVGAGRGVGEHGLVELALDLGEIDVLDQHHRALPDRRHRLVGRVGLVDPQPDLARIGNEPRLQQRLVATACAPSSACCFS